MIAEHANHRVLARGAGGRSRWLLCLGSLSVALTLGSGGARATEHTEAKADNTEPLWEWSLAGFTRYGAEYPGASENDLDVIPLPFPRYRGRFLRIGEETDNPLRGRLLRRGTLKLDVDFDINFGVDSEDVPERLGMPDLDFLLEVGPELGLGLWSNPAGWELLLNLPLRAAFSFDGLSPGYEGLVVAPELRLNKSLSSTRSDEISFRVTSTFANDGYMNYFYEVPTEFASVTRPAFDASGGYLSTELGITGRKQLGERYEIVGGVKLELLEGARNDASPLLAEDSNASVFVAFLWKFWESKRRVPVRE